MALSRLVLPIFFLLFFISPILPAAGASEKVSLGLYYESLCPYSANFIVNYLAKIFKNGLLEIVDLNLVPYGNARLSFNGTITCQVTLSPSSFNLSQFISLEDNLEFSEARLMSPSPAPIHKIRTAKISVSQYLFLRFRA